MGEHLPCKQGVRSSNLLVSTKKRIAKNCTMKTAYHQKKYKTQTEKRLIKEVLKECQGLYNLHQENKSVKVKLKK